MIVYHGSTMEIKKPDVGFSKQYLDFGKGFYLTTYQSQAEKWALRKGLRQRKAAVVNVYKMSESLGGFRVLSFKEETSDWLDFVCACRRGEDVYQKYDIIIGSVADDDVFKTVDLYFRGVWEKERALRELRYYKMNDQICIINQSVLNEILIYRESYLVERKNGE